MDEDEQEAIALGGVRFDAYIEGGDDGWAVEADPGGEPGAILGDERLAKHLARHDPARVLADVQVWRAITALAHSPAAEMHDPYGRAIWDVLLLRVQPYADHPDFDPAWRIDTAGHV